MEYVDGQIFSRTRSFVDLTNENWWRDRILMPTRADQRRFNHERKRFYQTKPTTRVLPMAYVFAPPTTARLRSRGGSHSPESHRVQGRT
jgi:hypothetical protein